MESKTSGCVLAVLQGKMLQFCGKTCCDEYKKRSSIMAVCEYCKVEKIIKEMVRFSGINKPFCSEGKKGQDCLSHFNQVRSVLP